MVTKHSTKKLAIILSLAVVAVLVACHNETKSTRHTEKELIGRIITHDDFLVEITKRIDLDDYMLEEAYYENSQDYVYTSKADCEIKKAKSNFAIEVDGIKFNLPITMKEFVDLGFKLSYIDVDTDSSVNLNTYINSQVFNVTSPKGNTFSIYSVSKNGNAIPIKDSLVMQVSCGFYKDTFNYGEGERSDAPEIKFFKNVTGKSSIDGILKELKTPSQISFSASQYKGETTLTTMQFDFSFSNETYTGSLTVTTKPVRDGTIKRTSYITDFSYLIDYESIKNS